MSVRFLSGKSNETYEIFFRRHNWGGHPQTYQLSAASGVYPWIRETEYKRLRFSMERTTERTQGAQAQERGGQTTLRGLKANRRKGYE